MNDFYTMIAAYVEYIKTDYANWMNADQSDSSAVQIRHDMIERFNDGISVERGSKYVKIVSGSSVHSFIVVKPDAKFEIGDILKAASWAAPAKNYIRGNIFTGDFKRRVRWTGVI